MKVIVLCTGISGSGQLDYLKSVAEVIQEPSRIETYDLGKVMEEISQEMGHKVPLAKLVDLGIPRDLLAGWAFERIKSKIKDSRPEVIHVIVCHASFRRWNVLYPGIDVSSVRLLSPDLVINIIDDISHVENRLRANPTWRGKTNAISLAIWREEEILLSWILARYQGVDFYVIPQAELPITLINLLTHPEMPKIYLSYPITNIYRSEKKEEFLQELEILFSELREHFVVFDPLSIKDLQILPESANREALAGQTVERDYMLVEQSDLVVVYYPVSERSFGVAAEMRYAKQFGKPVYAQIEEKSPFLGEFVDYSFETREELVSAAVAQYKRGR